MIYAQADYFRIPLLDGHYGVGQVFETSAGDPNALFCGLTGLRTDAAQPIAPFPLSDVIALVRIADSAITDQQWPLAGFDQIPRFRDIYDYDGARALGFPDKPVHAPAVIEAFINAVHGLYPWDSFGALFDQIKRPDIALPHKAQP